MNYLNHIPHEDANPREETLGEKGKGVRREERKRGN
jgi:hypothetical protein